MCQIPRTKTSIAHALVPRKTVTILQSLLLPGRTSLVEVWIDLALGIQSEKDEEQHKFHLLSIHSMGYRGS